jgi:hypothetical protein
MVSCLPGKGKIPLGRSRGALWLLPARGSFFLQKGDRRRGGIPEKRQNAKRDQLKNRVRFGHYIISFWQEGDTRNVQPNCSAVFCAHSTKKEE